MVIKKDDWILNIINDNLM